MNKVILLKELHLKYFKGIKDLSIYFGKTTDIYGENASGKSTIFDSFTYNLFEKDSRDRKEFSIKTFDSKGIVIPGVDHIVELVISVNGEDIKLKKIYKEKWTKKRGEAHKTLTGHNTLYYINDLPVQKKDYSDYINSIVEENVFKLLTNPLYFNSILGWKERRDILLTVVGDLSDKQVIDSNDKLSILTKLLGNTSVEDYKKKLWITKKKLNEELLSLPYRLDEINNSLKHISIMNFQELESRNLVLNKEIEEVDNELGQLNKEFSSLNENIKYIFSKKERMRDIEAEHLEKARQAKGKLQQQLFQLEQELSGNEFHIKLGNESINNMDLTLKKLKDKLIDLRSLWFDLDNKNIEFNENDFICPTCGRELPEKNLEDKKAEIEENFIKDKKNKMDSISNEGKNLAEDIKVLEVKIEKENLQINSLKESSLSLEEKVKVTKNLYDNFIFEEFVETSEYKTLKEEINALNEIQEKPNENLINKLKTKRSEKIAELEKLKDLMREKNQYEKAHIRIEELKAREKELGNIIADLEGKELLCEEFIRSKVDLLEERINTKFSKVKFKLFNSLINGSIEECCFTLVEGIPYEDANNAAKFNAGMDIINTLTNHYRINAPVFIDNRESINDLIESESQIINLRVSKDSVLVVDKADDYEKDINKNYEEIKGEAIESCEFNKIIADNTSNEKSNSIGPGF
ncbi:AAA family ATPase [Clostridium grantii]|uniref:Rad50/SbcC-type AAA domain-containing protein n=1 Tax=Clostridium grantii DSM 8605 TaxID=1121316 RepID=A0A1M5XMG3_9CLOT|nr:AAA family ATPase [Clostridium grantii]SHI00991.1 Protein of unknown function [Clostridium grantii DSM 8605]